VAVADGAVWRRIVGPWADRCEFWVAAWPPLLANFWRGSWLLVCSSDMLANEMATSLVVCMMQLATVDWFFHMMQVLDRMMALKNSMRVRVHLAVIARPVFHIDGVTCSPGHCCKTEAAVDDLLMPHTLMSFPVPPSFHHGVGGGQPPGTVQV
jgi:hypothetical protein